MFRKEYLSFCYIKKLVTVLYSHLLYLSLLHIEMYLFIGQTMQTTMLKSTTLRQLWYNEEFF